MQAAAAPARRPSEARRPPVQPSMPYVPTQDLNSHAKQIQPCHCKKSMCLKLYCDCFASGLAPCCACHLSSTGTMRVRASLLRQVYNWQFESDPSCRSDGAKETLSVTWTFSQHIQVSDKGTPYGAGHYCGDTCVCHNCHNLQDHKDLVTQTIAYTRSRNPASFEAKVCCPFLVVGIACSVDEAVAALEDNRRGCGTVHYSTFIQPPNSA